MPFFSGTVVLVIKNLPADAVDWRRGFHPWVRTIPWRRAWQPTPVFPPGESHGQRLVTKLCPTLATPWTICSLSGSPVHGILQARMLERVPGGLPS